MTSHARSLAALPEPEAHLLRPAGNCRLSRPRSRKGATLLLDIEEFSSDEQTFSQIAHRHRVKPGITGWAQINGSRGPVHTKEEVRERIRLDLEYVNRRSFWLDLYIMLMTAPCLLGDRHRAR